jgi:lysophospholipase L1-like esterase
MATFREIQTRDVADLGRGGDTDAPRGVPYEQGHDHRGIVRALVILASALVVWSLPYLVPGLEGYRPWTQGSSIPFAELFRRTSSGLIVAETGGGVSSQKSVTPQERALLSLSTDRGAGAAVGAAAGGGASPKTNTRPRFAGLPKGLKVAIPKKDYVGVKVTIEDPKGAMKPFYEALARTARKEPGAVTRISQWGDSSTAPDKITAVTRILLQKRFGDAGYGFMLATPATRWYRYAGMVYQPRNWKKRRITHGNARDKRYGLGGVRAMGGRTSSTSYAPSATRSVGRNLSRFEVYYLKGPGQGKLSLTVDRKPAEIVSAQAEQWQDAVHTIKVTDGHHRFVLGVKRAPVSVYGVVLERDGPGVVYDNLGLVGYAAIRILNADPEHLKTQLAFRKPDLMVLMFGGNTLKKQYYRPERYEQRFTKAVRRFKLARPQASCLVLSPLDHGEKVQGKVRTIPKLLTMIAVQRKVALANGCAFYSFFDAMGGKATMARWYTTRPRLVLHDFAHVTRDGARILGSLLYRALVAGFVEQLKKGSSGAR